MSKQIQTKAKKLNIQSTKGGSEFGVCPRCGGDLVAGASQIRAAYPSPPLQSLTCSNQTCNYTKYLKADNLQLSSLSVKGR